MTPRQRLAFIILQLNYGYSSWSEALQLAREAALGNQSEECRAAAEHVQSALRAADAAIATIEAPAVTA